MTNGCRAWRGIVNEDGYGIIRRLGRNWRVHRWVWTLANGPIAPGVKILHRCDNPPCYLLAHLFEGTQADNVADMIDKGRRSFANRARGEHNSNARLTERDVVEMRATYAEGSTTQRALGEKYGLAITNIRKALTGRTWAHVGGPLLPKRRPGRPAGKAP